MWVPNVSTSNSASNLNAGSYEVRIVDKDNPECLIKLTIMLTNPDAPEAEVVQTTPESCAGNDGTATLSPEIYTYSWSDGGSGHFRNDLAAGVYTVVVKDTTSNCISELQVTIGQLDSLETDVVSITDETCEGANGTAHIVPAIYDYAWSDGGAGAIRNDLSAGTYSITATDSKTGCSTTLEIIIELENTLISAAVIKQHAGLSARQWQCDDQCYWWIGELPLQLGCQCNASESGCRYIQCYSN